MSWQKIAYHVVARLARDMFRGHYHSRFYSILYAVQEDRSFERHKKLEYLCFNLKSLNH